MSKPVWIVLLIIAVLVAWFVLKLALALIVPQNVSGAALLKQELQKRGVPHKHLPAAFFAECVTWADKLASVMGHGSHIKRKAELVQSLETLADMAMLWRSNPGDAMFSGDKNTYRGIFEKYELRDAHPTERFGCDRCWPASADDAWAAISSSSLKTHLIDESHYIVSIWLCPTCTQHFLNVTTEMIDWEAGEDPIYRTFMPITQAELSKLMESSPLTEAILNAVGPGRRCLKYDWPKDHPKSVYWSTGVLVGPHD